MTDIMLLYMLLLYAIISYIGVNMKTRIQITEGKVIFFNQNLVIYSEENIFFTKFAKMSPQNLTSDLYCL